MMKKVKHLAWGALLLSSIGGFAQNQPQPGDNTWSLQESIEYALANNLNVRQSELQLNADQALAFQAKAALLPTINASANYAFNEGRTINPTDNTFINTNVQTSRIGINGSLLLFQGGQQLRTIQQNKTQAEASQFSLLQARYVASLNVAVNYLQVLNTQELVEAARFQVDVSQQQVERTEKLVKAGSLPQTDLLDLQAQRANDQLSLTNAENNLRLAKLNLQQSMNLPAQGEFAVENIELAEPTINAYGKTAQQVYETALETQYSVKSADLRVKSSQFGILAARGLYYPTLSLNAGINSNYSDQTQRFNITGSPPPVVNQSQVIGYLNGRPTEPVLSEVIQQAQIVTERYPYVDQIKDNRSQFVSLNLNIPILNGWQTRTQVSRAVIQQKTNELDAQTVRVQLRQDIEQAYNNMEAAASQYLSNKQQVEALELAYRAAETRLNVGAINSVDYNIAKANLDRARANLIQAKYSYYFRLKVLDFYQNRPLTF